MIKHSINKDSPNNYQVTGKNSLFFSSVKLKARTDEELAKSNFDILFLRVELNFHLIGQRMNHQAGILRIITKNNFNKKVKKRLSRSNLVENRNPIWGVCPTKHGCLFCETEAGHANWCHVVG